MENHLINNCLETVLHRHAPAVGAPPAGQEAFAAFFSALGWRLRRQEHTLMADERELLKSAGLAVPETLRLDEIARIHALRRMMESLSPDAHVAWLETLVRRGDNGEREAVLRGLMLLSGPERFLTTAIDACRAVVQTTFEAVACENGYPAAYFMPDAFRAMVLKALHLGVPVGRIHGLEMRADAELSRMASDYAAELRAAGRPVPADVIFIEETGRSNK